MSRTLSGLFLVGALNRPRKRKRTDRENPRTIPDRKIGKVPKRTRKEGQVQIGKRPRLKPPRLAALDWTKIVTAAISQGLMERLLSDQFFEYMCEWCETPKPTTTGMAYVNVNINRSAPAKICGFLRFPAKICDSQIP